MHTVRGLQGCCSVYVVGGATVNKFARGKSGWAVVPHAMFFRELGGLIYDGVAFALAGFKVPNAADEGLLASSKEQPQPGKPQPTGARGGASSSTSVNPAEVAALVESGEIGRLSTRASLADTRCCVSLSPSLSFSLPLPLRLFLAIFTSACRSNNTNWAVYVGAPVAPIAWCRDLKAALGHLGMSAEGSKQELRARLEQAAAERRGKVPRAEVVGSLLWREK